VTITAGLEKLSSVQAKATTATTPTGTSDSSTIETRANASGATQDIAKGKWALVATGFMIAYSALYMI